MLVVKALRVLFLIQSSLTSLCSEYQHTMKYVRNCDAGDQVIRLINSSMELRGNCDIISGSCSEIKAYRKAVVEVTVYKGNIPIFQKKTDLCDPKSKKSETFRVGLAIFAIPLACSFNSSTFCYKGERLVTFTQSTLRLLNAFPLNGRSAVFKMIITHDTGKSCFETEMEIYKE